MDYLFVLMSRLELIRIDRLKMMENDSKPELSRQSLDK